MANFTGHEKARIQSQWVLQKSSRPLTDYHLGKGQRDTPFTNGTIISCLPSSGENKAETDT